MSTDGGMSVSSGEAGFDDRKGLLPHGVQYAPDPYEGNKQERIDYRPGELAYVDRIAELKAERDDLLKLQEQDGRWLAELEAERDALRRAYEHLLEASIARWHDTYAGTVAIDEQSLVDWLEIDAEQYKRWVENPEYIIEVSNNADA